MSTREVHPRTRLRLSRTGAVLLAVLVALLPSSASGNDCPSRISTPPGLPVHGGTVTVHPGIAQTCVVLLPGGVVLRADGDTALAPYGRAIFRVSGSGPGGPGGLSIVVSASITDTPNAPELQSGLNADAVVVLPPDTVLVRFEPATGRFVPVPRGHMRLAALYKVLRRGTTPAPLPAPPPLPATLPATGSSPFGLPLALGGGVLLIGIWLTQDVLRPGGRRICQSAGGAPRRRVGLVLLVSGGAVMTACAVVYAYAATRPTLPGFGTFTDRGGPVPVRRTGGASGAATRLAIPRLGIDTPVIALGIADGRWQVPAYAAGSLSGGAWPGSRGNVVITGHDDRDGSVFRRLSDLRAGDVVQVYAGRQVYRYTVTALRVVAATQTSVLRPTRSAALTLITCFPYLIDTERVVAHAQLQP